MKILSMHFIVVIILATVVSGCGPSAEDILERYESYPEFQVESGKSGVYLEVTANMISIRYSSPLLNTNEEYVKILAKRWFVADAENPSERLSEGMGITTINSTINGITQPTTYGHTAMLKDLKQRFLLIGFEGIQASESETAEIPPLFFIIENKKGIGKNLTDKPRLSGELFTATYIPTRFVVYSTLTVQKINLATDAWVNLSLKSIDVTDDKREKITVPDLEKWFENAKVKKSILNAPKLTVTFGSEGATNVSSGDDISLKCDFEIGDKIYPIELRAGTELLTEKTPEGKYILLPEGKPEY